MKERLQASGFRLQTEPRHIPQEILLGILRAYKYAISPLLPPACRYVPTCSEYAAEAIERHGAIRGVLLSAWRLLRCHPFVKGGFDPVPLPQVPRGQERLLPHSTKIAPNGDPGPRHTVRACPH